MAWHRMILTSDELCFFFDASFFVSCHPVNAKDGLYIRLLRFWLSVLFSEHLEGLRTREVERCIWERVLWMVLTNCSPWRFLEGGFWMFGYCTAGTIVAAYD